MILWYMINDLILVIQMINRLSYCTLNILKLMYIYPFIYVPLHVYIYVYSFACIYCCICMYVYSFISSLFFKVDCRKDYFKHLKSNLIIFIFLIVLIAYISSTTYPDFALYIKKAIWNIPTKQQGTTTTISTTIPTTIATTTTSCSGSPCDNV